MSGVKKKIKRRNRVLYREGFNLNKINMENKQLTQIIELLTQIELNTRPKKRAVKSKKAVNSKTQKLVFSSPLDKTMNDYIETRKGMKKPMTDRAIDMLNKRLNKLSNSDEEKIEILEQSIVGGWLSVYPLSTDKRQELSANMKAMLMIEKNRNDKGGMTII